MSSTISSFSLSSILRQTVSTAQSTLATDEQELSTGTYADVGETLGAETGQDLLLRSQQSLLQTIEASNTTATTNLNSAQTIVGNIQTSAQNLLQSLLANGTSNSSAATIQQDAQNSLQDLINQLNTNVGGEYIFGGINSSVAPVAPFTTGSASSQAVDNAFASTFGFSQSSASVSTISATQMQSFLTNQFAPLFQGTNWSSNWSSASDTPIVNQISPTQTAVTSTTANQPAFQQLAQAFTMLSDLGTSNLGEQAYQTVVSSAESLLQSSIAGLTTIQSGLGSAQSAITNANN